MNEVSHDLKVKKLQYFQEKKNSEFHRRNDSYSTVMSNQVVKNSIRIRISSCSRQSPVQFWSSYDYTIKVQNEHKSHICKMVQRQLENDEMTEELRRSLCLTLYYSGSTDDMCTRIVARRKLYKRQDSFYQRCDCLVCRYQSTQHLL